MRKFNNDILVTFFSDFNFNETQIRMLIFSFNRYKDNFENLEELESYYTNYESKMTELGYSEEEIRNLVTYHPKAMFQTFFDGFLEEYYQKYLDQSSIKKDKMSIEKRVEENSKILKNLGLEKEKIAYIIKMDLPIVEMSPSVLMDNILFYLKCGIAEEELKTIVNNNSTVLLYGSREYDILFAEFPFFKKSDFKDMVINYSKNNTLVQPDILYKTLKFAVEKRLDLQRLIKCLKTNMIKNVSPEELDKSYADLLELGFSEEQIRKCVSDYFSILYKPTTKIEYIITVAKKYGVSKEDIITILTGFAGFTDFQEEKIIKKIAVMTRYNLTSHVVRHPKSLIQGVDLIDARAVFLRTFYPYINGDEFASEVFMEESAFMKKYNRENSYLKELKQLLK